MNIFRSKIYLKHKLQFDTTSKQQPYGIFVLDQNANLLSVILQTQINCENHITILTISFASVGENLPCLRIELFQEVLT